jgi:hypothetical protein
MATDIQHPLSQIKPSEAANEALMEIFNVSYMEGAKTPEDIAVQGAWNKRLESAFLEKFGYEFPGKSKISPMAFYGPPGHGKSASFRQAGVEFCRLMDLDFHEDPPADFVPDRKRDFVMVTLEMAGEVSNQTVGGIPSKAIMVDADGVEHAVMDKLVQRQFLMLAGAAGGMLLLDDFNNASHNVQNMLLPIAQYRRFQTVKFGNCYVGFTGNLGAADGTQVFNPKLALKSRMRQMYVEDSPEDFVLRADRSYAKRPDSYLRAKDIVNAFVATNTDMFAGNPAHQNIETGDTYNCPRTWEALIERLGQRMPLFEVGSASSSAQAAQTIAHQVVGSQVCQEFGVYFYQMMTSALPLARELMDTGTFKPESATKFKDSIGNGVNAAEQDFAKQFALALANVGAEKLLTAEKLRGQKKADAMNAVGRAMLKGVGDIDKAFQQLAFTRLRSKVENVIGDILASSAVNDRGNEIWKGLATGIGDQMRDDRWSAADVEPFKALLSRTLGKRDALSGDQLNVG